MKTITSIILALSWSMVAFAQTGIPVASMSHCDQLVTNFLSTYDIPGATLAIAKDGKLVYARGFGDASLDGTEDTQPHHMFRIASVSKPITSIAVMKLVEQGKLSLSDKAFGPNGLLKDHDYLKNVVYSDTRIDNITVQHLLEHSGGWNRDVDCVDGIASPYTWQINHCDPIGFPLHVTETLRETNPVRGEVLIRYLMEKGLNFAPGTSYAYSNIGFLVLGEIISEVAGLGYEAYIKDSILTPLGICDMHIGKNYLADKRLREAEYKGNGYTSLNINGDGTMVPWEYGGLNVEAMDAHGGWIATARDLVRLLSAVDGFATRPDILTNATLTTMTTPSANASYYAKGWTVNQFNNWWHTGAIDGTASIWVRASNNGYLWAFITNKRIIDNQSNAFWSDLDGLPWSCVQNTSTWPSHDLFDVPNSSTNLGITADATPGQVSLNWTSGNGDNRIVVAREGASISRFPFDGSAYSANAGFGQGDDLGDGHFVVYEGTGNQAVVTGLDPSKTYHFQVFDYNSRASTSNLPLYQLCSAPSESIDLADPTNIASLTQQGIQAYPNPGHSSLQLYWNTPDQVDRIEVRSLQGQLITSKSVRGTSLELQTETWAAQMYLVSCFKEGEYLGSLRWIRQ